MFKLFQHKSQKLKAKSLTNKFLFWLKKGVYNFRKNWNWDNLAINHHNYVKKASALANLVWTSIYTTSSAFMGISDISSFKSATATIKNTSAKHQISTSSSCFLIAHQLQLLLNSSNPNKQTLSRSVWPSVAGWYSILIFNSDPIALNNSCQNWLVKTRSRSYTIVCGRPCNL
jgi:hypothetical protein